MTKKKRYKRYSPEFKREALMRAGEDGVNLRITSGKRAVGWRGLYAIYLI